MIRTLPRFWPERPLGPLLLGPLLGFPLALAMGALPWVPPAPALALELRGRTTFTAAPVKVSLRNFYPYAWQAGGEYYFTVVLPAAAGEALGGLRIQQTRGADWSFPFLVERSRAFLGEPRREGAPVPVEARFDAAARRFDIQFPQPVAPGQTLTVALRPVRNPGQADTYLFAVTAFPAGPQPEGAPVGVARLAIYDAWPF